MIQETELQSPLNVTTGSLSLGRTEEREQRRRPAFNSIRIKLASPDVIRSWSHGEVTKPETINYRSFKPEKDGLFCEKIFGPVKDWECNCGKYKRIRYRGVICDRCGVEVTQAKVRRERLGHIELAVPVSHIWFFKGVPSRIGHLLDMSIRDLERILYYESYVVIEPGNTGFKKREIITEDQYNEVMDEQPDSGLKAKMGAEAIRDLLTELDLEELSTDLRAQAKMETSVQRKKEQLKRLRIVEAFRHSGNRPEWMILETIPVLPPDLRPLVPLEGGRFATSDLNDLYRRVINRNNRLKKLMDIKAPEVILRNEKRMLQEAVDALFDNGRRSRAVRGQGNRPLKSLSDMLKGKQGRFRQNLLGKRVDYSGRSVIVVGPELNLNQCGLPKNMALELFKPFIIRKLEDRGYVQTVKSAKRLVEREKPEVWDILGEIIQNHPVLLNRAPTLHRLGIQGFEPVLVEGKAIRIHPLVCQAFNADFDGDQMAVHVPLSFEAQIETSLLMLSTHNILSPANGRPLATPNQDIVLGCHYLTKPRGEVRNPSSEKASLAADDPRRLRVFYDPIEVRAAWDNGEINLHGKIALRASGLSLSRAASVGYVETTAGRVLFNEVVPRELGFINETMDKKRLESLVGDCYGQLGAEVTSDLLDALKNLGFKYATQAGFTVGIDDVRIPPEKDQIIAQARQDVDQINANYRKGLITEGERYNKVINTWTLATTEVEQVTFEGLSQDREGFNPIYMMADSGSRGNREQIRQLAGMRGLMAKPQKKITGGLGEIIESPVIHNFKEGLDVLEYFISTHGARKGLADTALKTADAGYLTRRLVDVAQDVIINELDCGTIRGLSVGALKDGEEVIEPLADRVLGRVAAEDVIHPISSETIVEAGQLIDEELAARIDEVARSGKDKIRIRSVLTCDARRGVCAKCYGRNLATGRPVDLGEAVGVIAAQSIGEPGTQLTLRTFHIGGVAARIVEESRALAKDGGLVRFANIESVPYGDGVSVCVSHNGEIELLDTAGRVRQRYSVPYGAHLFLEDGVMVAAEQKLFEWDIYNKPIVTERAGTVRFVDVKEKITVRDEVDDTTGMKLLVIMDDRNKELQPAIDILGPSGQKLAHYPLPTGSRLEVRDGQPVKAGAPLVKIRREEYKARDITGGLPRVAELFEARRPKDAAFVSEIDGHVEFGGVSRGMRKLIVRGEDGTASEYPIPQGKHVYVQEGSLVRAGDRLTEGPINPHDVLKIKGIEEVQEYLVDEIQEVYRLQGVRIDDKHIEVIVRQMLQKVRIEDPGNTTFLEGEHVDRLTVLEENERMLKDGQAPATFQPLLLGITKASLSTDSFISAASFQETTRVLTEAAIQGKVDYLRGLKENVIIGHLVPAGTGMPGYRRLRLDAEQEVPAVVEEAEGAKTA
ncbi:MAG: DNA-directed RNA polymerase subunit beta' [Candidatus Eisenbacteria bacterium RBG_16_71_46]|nr:MAG: DNA-directed RNA polymerase subunit beta' [Candidatus Eisenbacteria bacterium RBG_16_71_46]OGF23332.1 MAG: DNA-directed RNA polymerase subunit beta' [Candidatus Eisenbacteria bacterium RBG_19FT_COMBO_70_11]